MRFSPRPPENRMSPRPDLGPKPHLGYIASLIDRAAHRRNEAAAFMSHPGAGAYVVGGQLIITRQRGEGGDPLFGFAEARALAPVRETVLLGFRDGTSCFGVGIVKDDAEAL